MPHIDSPIKGATIDHIAMPTSDLRALIALKRYLGWETENTYRPDPVDIGDGNTSMRTMVVSTPGKPRVSVPVQLALMQGIDDMSKSIIEHSQVSAYLHQTRGIELMVQHIAYRIPSGKLLPLVRDWQTKGVRFITEYDGTDSPFCIKEENGVLIRQAFTYPIMPGGLFYELREMLVGADAARFAHTETPRDQNIQRLWMSLRKLYREKTLFKLNIFGELGSLRYSLEKRGIPIG